MADNTRKEISAFRSEINGMRATIEALQERVQLLEGAASCDEQARVQVVERADGEVVRHCPLYVEDDVSSQSSECQYVVGSLVKGATVQTHGLNRKDLNNLIGVVVGFDCGSQRHMVQLKGRIGQTTGSYKFKADNLSTEPKCPACSEPLTAPKCFSCLYGLPQDISDDDLSGMAEQLGRGQPGNVHVVGRRPHPIPAESGVMVVLLL